MKSGAILAFVFYLVCLGRSIHFHEDLNQTHDQGFQQNEGPHYSASPACIAYLDSFIGNRNGNLVFNSKAFSSNCYAIDLAVLFGSLALRATCQNTAQPEKYQTSTITIRDFGPCVPQNSNPSNNNSLPPTTPPPTNNHLPPTTPPATSQKSSPKVVASKAAPKPAVKKIAAKPVSKPAPKAAPKATTKAASLKDAGKVRPKSKLQNQEYE